MTDSGSQIGLTAPQESDTGLGVSVADDDTDNDGFLDGEDDANHIGQVDSGESDPNHSDGKAMPCIPLLLL
jgi:hypothetical protein